MPTKSQVAGDRRIGCNVERPAYGQWPALSGEYLSGAGEKGERPEPRYPSPTRSRGSGSLFTGFSLLESSAGSGGRIPRDRCRPKRREYVVAFTRSLPPRRGQINRGHARIPASTQASISHPTQFNVKRGPDRSSGWGLSGLDPVSCLGSPFENLRASQSSTPRAIGLNR